MSSLDKAVDYLRDHAGDYAVAVQFAHHPALEAGCWLGPVLRVQHVAAVLGRFGYDGPAVQVEYVGHACVLSRKSSHSPGCIRLADASPSVASHPCQARKVAWMVAAACVCVRPAASLAARISDGLGLEKGPFGPRFGWLLIPVFSGLLLPNHHRPSRYFRLGEDLRKSGTCFHFGRLGGRMRQFGEKSVCQ